MSTRARIASAICLGMTALLFLGEGRHGATAAGPNSPVKSAEQRYVEQAVEQTKKALEAERSALESRLSELKASLKRKPAAKA